MEQQGWEQGEAGSKCRFGAFPARGAAASPTGWAVLGPGVGGERFPLEANWKALQPAQGRAQGFSGWVFCRLNGLSCFTYQFMKKKKKKSQAENHYFLQQLWLLLPGVGREPYHPIG